MPPPSFSRAEWRQCIHASAALLFLAGDGKQIKNVTLMNFITEVTGKEMVRSCFYRHMQAVGVRQMMAEGRDLGEVIAAIEERFCSDKSSSSAAAPMSRKRSIGPAPVDCGDKDNLAGRRAPKVKKRSSASKPATTSGVYAAVSVPPPLADIGNLPPPGGGTRNNASSEKPSRDDLYRCVHSYFRWRATTAAAWKLPSRSDRGRDGDGRRRRSDGVLAEGPHDRHAGQGPGVALGMVAGSSPTDGSNSKGMEPAASIAVAARGGAGQVEGRPDGSSSVDEGCRNRTGGDDGGDGEEVIDTDVEVRMCHRIVSALEEALPHLVREADNAGGLATYVGAGTHEEHDGSADVDRRQCADRADVGVHVSAETKAGSGGCVETGKTENSASSPATIEGGKLPDESSPEESVDGRGETDGNHPSSKKEATSLHQSASPAAHAPAPGPGTTKTTATTLAASAPSRSSTDGKRCDESNPRPSQQRRGPKMPSPELEIRYNAYPDHRRQIDELRTRLNHLQQLEVDDRSHHPPQTQPQHRHPPWPAPTTPWQQPPQLQHPEAAMYYHCPTHQQTAARFAAGGERAGVAHPWQASGPAGTMMMIVPPVAGPVLGPRGGPVPIAPAPARVGPDADHCPSAKVSTKRSGNGRERTGKDKVKVASKKMRGAPKEDDRGSSDVDDDDVGDDDDDDGSLTKMSDSDGESEDSNAEERDDDNNNSDSDYGSSETETESEGNNDNFDDDGHDDVPVVEETKTAVTIATSDNDEGTVRFKDPTSPACANTPNPPKGKKKRKIDQEGGQATTTTTSPDEVDSDVEVKDAAAAVSTVATVSDEAAPGASTAPKRRRRRNPSAAAVAMWETRFQELVEYHSDHGHCRVPTHYKPNPALGNWVMRLRRLYAKQCENEEGEPLGSNMLSRERLDRLNGLGFTWRVSPDYHPKPWEFRFDELVEFKEKFGHTRVPRRYKKNWQLGEWVKMQRTLCRKGKLSDDKIQRLNELGFEWNIVKYVSMQWEERFEQLVRFRLKHGHCNVTPPEGAMAREAADMMDGRRMERQDAIENQGGKAAQSSAGDKAFYRWSERQRQEYRKFQHGKESKLDGRKIMKLDQIGFDWMFRPTISSESSGGSKSGESGRVRSRNIPFERRMQQLCNFKRTHGHVRVPQSHDEDDSLGLWAGQMRQIYRKHMRGKTASAETQRRFEEMTKIGFWWNSGAVVNSNRAAPKPWSERYEELLEFRSEKGHTRVPQFYAGNPTLALWVATQRKEMKRRQLGKKSALKDDQIRLLNEIGFEWRVIFSSKKKTSDD